MSKIKITLSRHVDMLITLICINVLGKKEGAGFRIGESIDECSYGG